MSGHRLRQTHTIASVEVSPQTYDEVKDILVTAGYEHTLLEDGIIDMHGLGLARKEVTEPVESTMPVSHVRVQELSVLITAAQAVVDSYTLNRRESLWVAMECIKRLPADEHAVGKQLYQELEQRSHLPSHREIGAIVRAVRAIHWKRDRMQALRLGTAEEVLTEIANASDQANPIHLKAIAARVLGVEVHNG